MAERKRKGVSDLMTFKNTGGGSFRFLPNKIIKPKEEFVARMEDIPEAFRDIIVPLGEYVASEKIVPSINDEFKLKQVEEEEDKWVIVDSKEKVLSEVPMTKEEAEKILNQLK